MKRETYNVVLPTADPAKGLDGWAVFHYNGASPVGKCITPVRSRKVQAEKDLANLSAS